MKLSVNFITLAITLASVVNAAAVHNIHGIHHQHHAKRDIETRTETQTVVVNQFGEPWAGKHKPTDTTATATETVTATMTSTSVTVVEETSTTTPTPTSTTSSTTTSSSLVAKSTPAPTKGGLPEVKGDPEGEFPDGEVPCSQFPVDYGILPIDWLKTKGWTGIQVNGGAGSECTEGALCSYACPPGYSKAQWPSEQPASGESHGGLLCKNGKLYKTNPKYKGLCVKGHGNVFIKNTLTQSVPICRTDYPGSENMVVPLWSTPGSTQDLTVPDAHTYYTWKGLPTSAQYYVNPAGTPLEEGCVWGKPHGGVGNWSPMIFGAGHHNGKTWLSISQNQLYDKPLNFNVKIIGAPGAKLNGECKYEGGQWYGGAPGEKGCTSALESGDAILCFYTLDNPDVCLEQIDIKSLPRINLGQSGNFTSSATPF